MTPTRVVLATFALFGLVIAATSGAVWFVGLPAAVLALATAFALLMLFSAWRSWLQLQAAESGKARVAAVADLAMFLVMAMGAVLFILRDRSLW